MTLWDVEAQIVTPDGEEKWTHAIARPHKLPDGAVVWNGIILDATRIKRAEIDLRGAKEGAEEASRLQSELLERLQNADERLSSLAATIPGVVYQRQVTQDGDIRYTYISEGARDLFGVEPDDILSDSQALFECHGPEYRKTFRDRLLAASKDMTLWDVEAQIVTPDGQEKWTHAIARPQRREDGSVLWNGVILDATRIKEAEFAAAAAEERTRAAIVESVSQGIAIFDPDDRLMTWNSKLLDLFPGLAGGIAAGTDYRAILQAEADGCVEPDGSAPGQQMLRDRLKRHDEMESSVERRLADGRWILINERRSDTGTIVLYTDVTDLKRREEQLHLAKNRSELANVELEKTVRRLDIALGNMTQGLCLFNSQLRSILCNRRYAKIFRLPPELTGPDIALHDQISHVAAQGNADEADAVALVDDRLSYAASRSRCTYRLTLPDKRVNRGDSPAAAGWRRGGDFHRGFRRCASSRRSRRHAGPPGGGGIQRRGGVSGQGPVRIRRGARPGPRRGAVGGSRQGGNPAGIRPGAEGHHAGDRRGIGVDGRRRLRPAGRPALSAIREVDPRQRDLASGHDRRFRGNRDPDVGRDRTLRTAARSG